MKILVVEDDPFLQKALVTKFEKEKFEVSSSLDGNDAVEKGKLKPDLILLDLMLPKKSGFEVLAEYKKFLDPQKTKIIILSNLGQKDDIQKGTELGALDYIVKAEAKIDDIVKKVKSLAS